MFKHVEFPIDVNPKILSEIAQYKEKDDAEEFFKLGFPYQELIKDREDVPSPEIVPSNFHYQRYTNVLTKKQSPFMEPPYPAAKIPLADSKRSYVIAEGPYLWNLPNLLNGLSQLKIKIILAVGEHLNGVKYNNYMGEENSKKISVNEFLSATMREQANQINDKTFSNTNFEFYQYTDPANGSFYVLYIPNWEDHGLAQFNKDDITFLTHFAEHAPDIAAHCSAGIGRSVALLMLLIAWEKEWKDLKDLRPVLIQALTAIRDVKPTASEEQQYISLPIILLKMVACAKELVLQQENTVAANLYSVNSEAIEKKKRQSFFQPTPAHTSMKDDEATPLLSVERKGCCTLI